MDFLKQFLDLLQGLQGIKVEDNYPNGGFTIGKHNK